MKEELSELEWLMRAVDGFEVSLDGIVRFGKWYVSGDYIFYPSNGFRIDSLPIYIESIDTQEIFEPQYENLHKHLKMNGSLTKENELDFEKAFVYVWLISNMPNNTSIPSHYDIEGIKKSAIICTHDESKIVFSLGRPESYSSFEVLRDMDDYSLMHYPGFLHLYLNQVVGEPPCRSATLLFSGRNKYNLYYNPVLVTGTIDSGYDVTDHEYRCMGKRCQNYGFTAFLLNYIANKLHKQALLDSANPCKYMLGTHNEKEFWEKICFPNVPVMIDFGESYDINDVNDPLPLKVIFDEYLSYLLNENRLSMGEKPDFDICNNYDETNWWSYIYKQEVSFWESIKQEWLAKCLCERQLIIIDQYIVNFLNYLNLKFNLGNEFLELPHITYELSDGEIVSKKYKTKPEIHPQNIKQSTPPSSINHFYGANITLNEFQENSNCTIITGKTQDISEDVEKDIDLHPENLKQFFKPTFFGAGGNINHFDKLVEELNKNHTPKEFCQIAVMIYESSFKNASVPNTFSSWYKLFCEKLGCPYEKNREERHNLPDDNLKKRLNFLQYSGK